MATIYKVKIVSHWINYSEDELQKIIEEALKEKEKYKDNVMTVKVISRS